MVARLPNSCHLSSVLNVVAVYDRGRLVVISAVSCMVMREVAKASRRTGAAKVPSGLNLASWRTCTPEVASCRDRDVRRDIDDT